jgi:hypothetical protein
MSDHGETENYPYNDDGERCLQMLGQTMYCEGEVASQQQRKSLRKIIVPGHGPVEDTDVVQEIKLQEVPCGKSRASEIPRIEYDGRHQGRGPDDNGVQK